MRGKCHAFGEFRDVLAREMAAAMPELRDDVDMVLRATGGNPIMNGSSASATGPPGATS